MTKLFVTLPALALAITLSSSALAENGAISAARLNEMGLAGIEVMSDAEALEVRGMGFTDGHKSLSLAFGISYATVETNDRHLGEGSAGTLDGFLAVGKYMAMGEHLSEATIVKSKSHELWVKGQLAEKSVWTKSLTVAAGGKASASSL
jgi:hypothetical protein